MCLSRKQTLFISQQRRCYWCKKLCHLNRPTDIRGWTQPLDFFTEDHIVPRSRGGADSLENIVGACHECNRARNDIELKLQAGRSIKHFKEKPQRFMWMPRT